MGFIGGSQPVHTYIAPFPYFPFRSPGDSFSHLLWDTSPLSSPLCLLHLPPSQQSPEEFLFCVSGQKKTKQKARNKGRMLRGGGGAYLCPTPAGHHPAEQLSHGSPRLVPPGNLTNKAASDGERAVGPLGWAEPCRPAQECQASRWLRL